MMKLGVRTLRWGTRGFNYITSHTRRPVNIGVVLVVGGVAVSIGIAILFFIEYQPNIIHAGLGEPITVGPVRYVIEYDGTHEGDEKTMPENVFVKIRIKATNLSGEETRMSGGQFHIIHPDGTKAQPVYGDFSDEDLLDHYLQPGRESTWTTQFDVPFDDGSNYTIGILPTKLQSSRDIGMICLTC